VFRRLSSLPIFQELTFFYIEDDGRKRRRAGLRLFIQTVTCG